MSSVASELSIPCKLNSEHGEEAAILTLRSNGEQLETQLICASGEVKIQTKIGLLEQWLGELDQLFIASKVTRLCWRLPTLVSDGSSVTLQSVSVQIRRASLPTRSSLSYVIECKLDGTDHWFASETIADSMQMCLGAIGASAIACYECAFYRISPYGNMADFLQGTCLHTKRLLDQNSPSGAQSFGGVSTFHHCVDFKRGHVKV